MMVMSFIDSVVESFMNNLIAEDRYRMILDGLLVTLLITLFAVLLGTLLGGLVCWMRMSRRAWLRRHARPTLGRPKTTCGHSPRAGHEARDTAF